MPARGCVTSPLCLSFRSAARNLLPNGTIQRPAKSQGGGRAMLAPTHKPLPSPWGEGGTAMPWRMRWCRQAYSIGQFVNCPYKLRDLIMQTSNARPYIKFSVIPMQSTKNPSVPLAKTSTHTYAWHSLYNIISHVYFYEYYTKKVHINCKTLQNWIFSRKMHKKP